jgi:hypothetical protein
MKKIILLLIFPFFLLYSDQNFFKCETNLKEITHFYNVGNVLKNEEKYQQATDYFQKSITFSYLALETCSEHPKFDFNIINRYIMASEEKIYMIEEARCY